MGVDVGCDSHERKHNEGNQSGGTSIQAIIACQSLPMHFSNPQVWADFINGRFGSGVDPSIFPLLDEMRWKGGLLDGNNGDSKEAASHMSRLIRKSEEPVLMTLTKDNSPSTYAAWFKYLQTIAQSNYWQETTAESRCTHIFKESHGYNVKTAGLGRTLI